MADRLPAHDPLLPLHGPFREDEIPSERRRQRRAARGQIPTALGAAPGPTDPAGSGRICPLRTDHLGEVDADRADLHGGWPPCDKVTGRRLGTTMPWGPSTPSVLTTMAESAAFTCRVSSSTASKPGPARPACNHCDSGPASSPTRASGRPSSPEEVDERLRLARHLRLAHDPAGGIHHAHAAPFQGDIDPGMVLHGCPSLMPGADPLGPRPRHHSEGQPPRRSPLAQARYRI